MFLFLFFLIFYPCLNMHYADTIILIGIFFKYIFIGAGGSLGIESFFGEAIEGFYLGLVEFIS